MEALFAVIRRVLREFSINNGDVFVRDEAAAQRQHAGASQRRNNGVPLTHGEVA